MMPAPDFTEEVADICAMLKRTNCEAHVERNGRVHIRQKGVVLGSYPIKWEEFEERLKRTAL